MYLVVPKTGLSMCVSPSFIDGLLPGSRNIPISCGVCWRCLSNHVSGYVGRALCERYFADWSVTVTLTYRDRVDLAERVLNFEHFQRYIRSLRRRGHLVRYLVSGEYGKHLGRCHFHAILFGSGPRLEYPNKKRHWADEWPHGHLYADWDSDDASLRYTCKYLHKGDKASYWFSLSKKPLIGLTFLQEKAARDAALGVFPTSFEYLPPNADRRRAYFLTRAARREYMRAFLRHWRANGRSINPVRIDPFVWEAVEKADRYDLLLAAPELDFDSFSQELQRFKRHKILDAQLWPGVFAPDRVPQGGDQQISEGERFEQIFQEDAERLDQHEKAISARYRLAYWAERRRAKIARDATIEGFC